MTALPVRVRIGGGPVLSGAGTRLMLQCEMRMILQLAETIRATSSALRLVRIEDAPGERMDDIRELS